MERITLKPGVEYEIMVEFVDEPVLDIYVKKIRNGSVDVEVVTNHLCDITSHEVNS